MTIMVRDAELCTISLLIVTLCLLVHYLLKAYHPWLFNDIHSHRIP